MPLHHNAFTLPKAALVIGGRVLTQTAAPLVAHVNPATGLAQAEVTMATALEVDAAVASAKAALPNWRATRPAARRDLLFKLADLVTRDAEYFAWIGAMEVGTPISSVRAIPSKFDAWTKYAAGWADKMEGRVVSSFQDDSVLDYTLHEPFGVIGMVLTWNGPLMALAMKIGPALATGNTVVIKPPEISPFTATHFMTLVAEAGIPDGVVNLVTGGVEAGHALVTHPDVAKVAFTGGLQTARHIATAIAPLMKPALYELGGKSANLIFADADMSVAVRHAARQPLFLSGQGCVLPTRILVEDSIAESFTEAVLQEVATLKVGDPMDDDTNLGPVATKASQQRLLSTITEAAARGDGRLAAGGDIPAGLEQGFYVAPTIFTDVDPASPLAQNECFGPVVTITPFRDTDHAVEIANSTEFGLGAYIHSQSLNRTLELTHRLHAGNVLVNGAPTARENAPFGGIGMSGYGREGGRDGMAEFVRTKNVAINRI